MILHRHYEKLLAIGNFLPLHQLLNHLGIEHHFDGAGVYLVLIFATADHAMDPLDVLLVFRVRTLEVGLPPFACLQKVSVLLLHAVVHDFDLTFIYFEAAREFLDCLFRALNPLKQLVLHFKAFFLQFCDLNVDELPNVGPRLILI